MSEVLSVASSLNWWLVATVMLVLCYVALALVAMGYIDGRWTPRGMAGMVVQVVGGLLWLPALIAWLCYKVVCELLRITMRITIFFFDIGDTEAAQYNHRQRAAALVSDAREDGLPF